MNTQQLRQKILDLAIRGQLVPQDENDEPAQVLLEKIRTEKEKNLPKKGKPSSTSPYQNEEEFPFQIPENWVWCRLGEISKNIQYGVSKSAKDMGIYKLLRITDIQNDNVNWETVPFTDIEESEAVNFVLENNDFLFARTGATVGKSYLVKNLDTKSVYASYLIRISLLSKESINYVKYFFNSGFYWEQISEKSVGIGQPNVNGSSLKELKIPLPPLPEQHRIVSKIEEVFALIDTIEQNQSDLKTTIEKTKAKVLDMAICGELLNDENHHLKISDNEHYTDNLPKGWKKSTLGECFEWGSGGTPSSNIKEYYNGDIPWLVIGDLNDDWVFLSEKKITEKGLKNSSSKLVPKGTLLLAMYGSIGKLGIAGVPLATNQAIAFALENENFETKYLFYYLLSVRSELNLLGKGATQKNISQTVIKSFPFIYPFSIIEQKKIVQKIEKIFAELDFIEQNL